MTTEEQQYQKESSEISLVEILLKIRIFFKYLLTKWSIILAFCLIGAGLGFLYAIIKKPIYSAISTFVLEDSKDNNGGFSNLAGLASMAGVDIGGAGGLFQSDNILELYKSRKMIEKALFTTVVINNKSELLINRYIDVNKLRKQWKDKPELTKINFDAYRVNKSSRLQDSIVGDIVADINKNGLLVSKFDKQTGIIQAEVRSHDEIFAKNFNQAIVKNVSDFYIDTKTKKTANNIRVLQHKTDSVREVMNGAIYTAVAIADATPNLNPTRQVQRLAPSQKAQFSAETNKAILAEMAKKLEVSKLSLLKETPLIQIIDEPVYPLKKSFLSKTKGIIIGFFLFFFFTVLILGFKFYIKGSR